MVWSPPARCLHCQLTCTPQCSTPYLHIVLCHTIPFDTAQRQQYFIAWLIWQNLVFQGMAGHFMEWYVMLRYGIPLVWKGVSFPSHTVIHVVPNICVAKHVVYMSWCKLHSSVERPADSLAKVGDCREPPPLTSWLTSASALLFLSETL